MVGARGVVEEERGSRWRGMRGGERGEGRWNLWGE